MQKDFLKSKSEINMIIPNKFGNKFKSNKVADL